MIHIALLGEFDPSRETQVATINAIEHSSHQSGLETSSDWISTRDITEDLFSRYHAIWIAPGCKYLDQDKLFEAIRYAREQGVPCIGTCGGFQHMILEYARHELGISNAQSQEYSPESEYLCISQLECSLRGRDMNLTFTPGSLVEHLYGSSEASERYYCSFGINPTFSEALHSGKMRITGRDPEGDVRVIEWPDHPFFLATLYVPQTRSSVDNLHPLITGFLYAANSVEQGGGANPAKPGGSPLTLGRKHVGSKPSILSGARRPNYQERWPECDLHPEEVSLALPDSRVSVPDGRPRN
ncbi:CTP synthase (UTP-ammonia lyase) [Opitutaceae bacterium TAV1]|nr:CTP synthase (UTP-ammonia lyase) [Opitutaceae bacterium TAV1]